MNSHKNARTTFAGRILLIKRIQTVGLMPAASAAGISLSTARKWRARYQAYGEAGLMDRSSRPEKTWTTLDAELRERIERLRRTRMPMRTIARVVGRSVATISRVLAALRVHSLRHLSLSNLSCAMNAAYQEKYRTWTPRSSVASCVSAIA